MHCLCLKINLKKKKEENVNSPLLIKETQFVFKSLLTKKSEDVEGTGGEFPQTFKYNTTFSKHLQSTYHVSGTVLSL